VSPEETASEITTTCGGSLLYARTEITKAIRAAIAFERAKHRARYEAIRLWTFKESDFQNVDKAVMLESWSQIHALAAEGLRAMEES